jgi:hypothetical protein
MKNPENMTKERLVRIVREIRDWLWLREDEEFDVRTIFGEALANKLKKEQPGKQFLEYYDPGKEWDSDIFDGVADVLRNAGLAPGRLVTLKEGYPDRTPNQRWKDDEIQFARLLDELQGVGVINLLKEAEWQALESSMDLKRESILEIWDRASRAFDRIKADLCPKRAKRKNGDSHGTKS